MYSARFGYLFDFINNDEFSFLFRKLQNDFIAQVESEFNFEDNRIKFKLINKFLEFDNIFQDQYFNSTGIKLNNGLFIQYYFWENLDYFDFASLYGKPSYFDIKGSGKCFPGKVFSVDYNLYSQINLNLCEILKWPNGNSIRGKLTYGKYRGEYILDVFKRDYGYVFWLFQNSATFYLRKSYFTSMNFYLEMFDLDLIKNRYFRFKKKIGEDDFEITDDLRSEFIIVNLINKEKTLHHFLTQGF